MKIRDESESFRARRNQAAKKMETLEIVGQITSVLAKRREMLDLALDRGEGARMQIEEWVNTEMLLELSKLKKQDVVHAFQAKRNYRTKPGRKYPQCDLWWRIAHNEHWLEVKTITILNGERHGSTGRDPAKWKWLFPTDIYHTLTIIWPVRVDETEGWASELSLTYTSLEWICERQWGQIAGEDWLPYFFLYTRRRGI